MDSTSESALARLLGEIAGAQAPEEERIAESLRENELEEDGSVPDWLFELLTAVRDRTLTGWIDFPRSSEDDTNVFDFIRDLPQLLPVEHENNEESWMLTFGGLDIEACISLEGSCYKVSQIGKTWDDQPDA